MTIADETIITMPQSIIPPTVLGELKRQLNHELSAAHAYQAMSVWCAARNFGGFAEFFKKQAGEEREHAEKIIEHVLDRGVQPQLEAIPTPKQDFASLLEVAKQAEAMEQANTRGINAVYEAALAAKDYPAQVLMHWFINEQVEEEAWCAELIDRVEGATCAGSLSDLDRHIVKILTGGEGD
jgi:ferritin